LMRCWPHHLAGPALAPLTCLPVLIKTCPCACAEARHCAHSDCGGAGAAGPRGVCPGGGQPDEEGGCADGGTAGRWAGLVEWMLLDGGRAKHGSS
jgi:hypothetical protein